MMNGFVFTCGDVNGIGPEICIKTFNKKFNPQKHIVIFVCPANVFETVVQNIQPNFNFSIIKNLNNIREGRINIIDIGKVKLSPGKPTKSSGKISYKAILKGLEIIEKGFAAAMVTAPISKLALHLANIDFPGHTELLSHRSGIKNYLMMFLSRSMKTGLVTIHEPLKKVPGLISEKKISSAINTMHFSLKNDFGIGKPQIAVLGLNPHAGEAGEIGREEIDIIKPAIGKFENVYGPFVPDAFFGEKLYKKFDAVLGMYHDQVLIPFKLMNFRSGVNFTAGLPFVRTSPDHGTAFDIAGKFVADESSMNQAFSWADKIVNMRKKSGKGK